MKMSASFMLKNSLASEASIAHPASFAARTIPVRVQVLDFLQPFLVRWLLGKRLGRMDFGLDLKAYRHFRISFSSNEEVSHESEHLLPDQP